MALFCFPSFLLSARSCLSNYRVISRQAHRAGTQTRAWQKTPLSKPTKEAEEAAICMKCTWTAVRAQGGLAAEHRGKAGSGPAHRSLTHHLRSLPYRPVLSLLLCLQVRQHRACRKPGLWSKCFLSSSGPRLSALILHLH